MERWWLIAAAVASAVAGICGLRAVMQGRRTPAVVWAMAASFVFQFGFLWQRGAVRAACPINGLGEMLVFLAWSLSLFYLIIGSAYRWSPNGVFTAPLVLAFFGVAMASGVLEPAPPAERAPNAWSEGHAAMSVLSYGALAMAAVTAAMFLVLDHLLKGRSLRSGWFQVLPPARDLLVSVIRLLRLGVLLLTAGVVSGWMAGRTGEAGIPHHLAAASAVWLAYLLLLVVQQVRGISGRRLALASVGLFVVSLTVFAFL